MDADPTSAFPGPNPWEWWRAADDLWRWGVFTREIGAYDRADEPAREAIRHRRLGGMIEHARSASGFYREHYRRVAPGSVDLAAYPPVTRRMLMARFDDWVVDPRLKQAELREFVSAPARIAEPYLGKYTIWTSSGTTGVPGIYVQDADALAVYSALMSSRFELGGGSDAGFLGGGPPRLAFVAAIEGHFAGVVSWERQRRLYPILAMATRAFSILQPPADLVAQLNDWRPAYVSTYPTMLTLLADEHRAGRLRISPRGFWCGGEGLADADRKHIEESFGCSIIEDYGASECMNMAFGCRHGRLHVNDDWVVLEAVDEHYRPVPVGEPSSTVLVTNLANRAQPLIRYDLGDSVTFDPAPCPCGAIRPTLRVEGRGDDMLMLEPARVARSLRAGALVRVLPLAIETVLEEEADILRFQLTQAAPDLLCLRLDADSERARTAAFRRAKSVLARFLHEQGAAPVRIELDPLQPECNPVSGKLRRVRVLAGVFSKA